MRERVPSRWQHVMVLGNIKGALSMAAALALPAALPERERIITIVFGVTFITLVTQALPFRRLLGILKVTQARTDGRIDAARATLIAARRGLHEVSDLLEAGLVSRSEHARRRAVFQERVIAAEESLRRIAGGSAHDPTVDAALINAQKSSVLDAARLGLIAPEAAQAEIAVFDRALIALSHLEHDRKEGER